ncbi:tetratricopeptide repeat protein [Aquimarina celericrescens]|uniref:Tetratricopeptide repeat protein n=1 Tax=Aquimarina celericrescens TaxID=1964542 RepID=A0ABW5AVN3_9FLAO|nr:tetratricopeptide repeat protein [Aquimarina celericrescens]
MLQRYFLSIFISLFFCSCYNKNLKEASEEDKILSKKIFDEEQAKHDFDGPYQGTPLSMKLLDSILTLDPNNCEALRSYSVPYLKRGMPHKWKPLFDKAVACDPKTWQPWRGYLYLWFYRDYKKAIEDFDASDILTPNFVDSPQGHSVDYWRGIAYLGLKDYKNAAHYFNTHIARVREDSGEDWVEPSAFLYLGITYFEDSKFKKARINIEKALRYFQNVSADSHYYRALLYLEEGEYHEAIAATNKAIDDYKNGYYSKRAYVEEIRQIYPQQLLRLKKLIAARMVKNK